MTTMGGNCRGSALPACRSSSRLSTGKPRCWPCMKCGLMVAWQNLSLRTSMRHVFRACSRQAHRSRAGSWKRAPPASSLTMLICASLNLDSSSPREGSSTILGSCSCSTATAPAAGAAVVPPALALPVLTEASAAQLPEEPPASPLAAPGCSGSMGTASRAPGGNEARISGETAGVPAGGPPWALSLAAAVGTAPGAFQNAEGRRSKGTRRGKLTAYSADDGSWASGVAAVAMAAASGEAAPAGSDALLAGSCADSDSGSWRTGTCPSTSLALPVS
mmetsp:Transcript_77149/g.213241  ORF Transcript_77149/g.213241 Transcript_77149/m.213241 type:complete len:276 (+) Transcript_77149:282-1109(+)